MRVCSNWKVITRNNHLTLSLVYSIIVVAASPGVSVMAGIDVNVQMAEGEDEFMEGKLVE